MDFNKMVVLIYVSIILGLIFTLEGTDAQTVQIYPSQSAYAYVNGSLILTCSNNGIGSFFSNPWFRNTYVIGTVRVIDNVCTKYGQLRNETLYTVECDGDRTVHLTINKIQLENNGESWKCAQFINGTPYTSNATSLSVKVEGWACVSPVGKVYSRVSTAASLHFSADLSNLNSPRQFYISFYDNSAIARIRYNADRTYTTDTIHGVSIMANTVGNVTFTLGNVLSSSAGTYKMDSAGFPVRCTCLYVLGTPAKPTITVSSVPVKGGNLTLSCNSISTTFPKNHSLSLGYSWKAGNVDNPTGTRYSYTIDRKSLTLSNIADADLDVSFTCLATEIVTGGYTSSKSDLLSLRDTYGPEDIVLSPNETRYVYHENAMFSPVTCTARCVPPCSYQWTKVARLQSVNDSSMLDLRTLTRSEAGTYFCTATTPGGFSIAKKLSVSVLSFFVEGRETETPVTVNEYDNVQLSCYAGTRFSSTAKIMFKDFTLKEGDNSNTSSLTFIRRSIACTESGVYTCEGGDSYDQFAMNVTLKVRCAPRPLRHIQQEVSSRLNVPVTFSFTVIAFPEPGPAGFSWNKENDDTWTPLLSNEDMKIESSELQSNLTIYSVSQHNYGKYRVTVTNDVGGYEQNMFLVEEGGFEKQTSECSENNAVIMGTILGISTAGLAVYSVSLTIWVKRNLKSKGNLESHHTRTEQTYANESFIENVGAGQIDIKDTQYTSLDDTAKDRNVTYETLQTT